MNKAYQAMVEAAENLGLPKFYTDDLYRWDREVVTGDDPPPVFGWVLYDCGTHLLDSRMKAQNLAMFRRVFVEQGLFKTDRHCFVWDGHNLREMRDATAMLDTLDSYRKEVRDS